MLTTPVKKYILAKLGGGLSTTGSMYLENGYYLGLSNTTPNADGSNFTEPSGSSGYQRIKIRSDSSSSGPVYPFVWTSTSGTGAYTQVQNQYEIHFNVATANWGDPITHVGIFTQSGQLMAYGHLIDGQGQETSITVLQGHIPTIAAGQAKISLDIQ